MDAWSQGGRSKIIGGDLKKRMAYTMRRASKAILVTSSTTAFAFLATGFSTIMPISAFGYFAFVLVPMNYILVITIFPVQVVIYEKTFNKYFPKYETICCFPYNLVKKLLAKKKADSLENKALEDKNENQNNDGAQVENINEGGEDE